MHVLSLLRSSKTTPQLNFSLAISVVKTVTFNTCFSASCFEGLILKGLIFIFFFPWVPVPSPPKNGVNRLWKRVSWVRNFLVCSQAKHHVRAEEVAFILAAWLGKGKNFQMASSSSTRTFAGILQGLRHKSCRSNLHIAMCCLPEL